MTRKSGTDIAFMSTEGECLDMKDCKALWLETVASPVAVVVDRVYNYDPIHCILRAPGVSAVMKYCRIMGWSSCPLSVVRHKSNRYEQYWERRVYDVRPNGGWGVALHGGEVKAPTDEVARSETVVVHMPSTVAVARGRLGSPGIGPRLGAALKLWVADSDIFPAMVCREHCDLPVCTLTLRFCLLNLFRIRHRRWGSAPFILGRDSRSGTFF